MRGALWTLAHRVEERFASQIKIREYLLMCKPYDNQLPFRRFVFDRIPAHAFGVYGLWYDRLCIYIGKAEEQPIAKRLEQHWRQAQNPKLATWIRAKGSQLSFTYVAVDDKTSISALEIKYIHRFQPLTNVIRYANRHKN